MGPYSYKIHQYLAVRLIVLGEEEEVTEATLVAMGQDPSIQILAFRTPSKDKPKKREGSRELADLDPIICPHQVIDKVHRTVVVYRLTTTTKGYVATRDLIWRSKMKLQYQRNVFWG